MRSGDPYLCVLRLAPDCIQTSLQSFLLWHILPEHSYTLHYAGLPLTQTAEYKSMYQVNKGREKIQQQEQEQELCLFVNSLVCRGLVHV